MRLHLLSGFLGSGKTTAIQQACSRLMHEGKRVGVITNDQGIKLVDSTFFKHLDIPNRQVINGCFCCNYNQLNDTIESLIEEHQPDILFAESVGSCTDIVATVLKPLLHFRKDMLVSISTFADARLLYMLLRGSAARFDPSVIYIYFKQLEEAAILVVNKVDLVSQTDLQELTRIMHKQYPRKKIMYQNSQDSNSMSPWLEALLDCSSTENISSLDIDYNLYGTGEAKLAWLDQELQVLSTQHSASKLAADLANSIHRKIREQHYAIGHLKFMLNDSIKISFTATPQPESMIDLAAQPSSSATLLINARVQTTPAILSGMVNAAIEEITARFDCTILPHSIASFQPGFPRPTHRFTS